MFKISYSKELEDQFYSEIDVYSLSSNFWRRKDRLMLGTLVMNSFSKAFINGALHWGAITKKRGINRFPIISFGIKNEVTKNIKVL